MAGGIDAGDEFWPLALPAGVLPGARLTAVYRPEHFALATDGTGIPGTVESATFLGANVRLTIRLGSGRLIIADRPSHEAGGLWPRGTAVSLKPDPLRAAVITDEHAVMTLSLRHLPGIVLSAVVTLLLAIFIAYPIGAVLVESFVISGPMPPAQLKAATSAALDAVPAGRARGAGAALGDERHRGGEGGGHREPPSRWPARPSPGTARRRSPRRRWRWPPR